MAFGFFKFMVCYDDVKVQRMARAFQEMNCLIFMSISTQMK